MTVLLNQPRISLWQEVIKSAESRCAIILESNIETYLVTLLIYYTNKPEIVKQVIATTFLKAQQLGREERREMLQQVGDQCLIFSGLFPHIAQRKHVKISYFVDIGRSAYAAISKQANDLPGLLASQFVLLMDVLQSIPAYSNLMPLEAYEQWSEVGSQRALRILQKYTQAVPVKK